MVSFRLDEPVVERFGDYAYYKRLSKKKALETIITEYLDGRGLDEDTRRVLERFDSEVRKCSITQLDTPERAEKVDGRDRYSLCGGAVKAEDAIADVMECVVHPTRRSVRQIGSSPLIGYRGHFNVATQCKRVL